MPVIHVISLKLGASHGLWQYKISGTHERVVMHDARRILDETCRILGLDCRDRSVVFLFTSCAEAFEAAQVCLQRTKATRGWRCGYRVKRSTIGDFRATGTLPAALGHAYFGAWPSFLPNQNGSHSSCYQSAAMQARR